MNAIMWLVIFLILLMIEIVTLGLTTIWFAGGALISFIATLLGANLVVQLVLFTIISLILLFVTRPIALKYFNKNLTKTNVDEAIGKTAVVSTRIDNVNGTGEAVLAGDIWMARSKDNDIIEKGTKVDVVTIEGVKLIVRAKEEKENV